MALIGEMQYLTIGGNTYSLPSGGGGSVTSVAVSNATNGGLSVSGSPISSSGTITIGHSNVLSSAQTTQAVYPIKIDKNGHISAYGNAVTIPTVPSNIVNTITTTAGAHTAISSKKGDVSFNVPTKTSHLTNDSGFITGYTETDPTVPSWAKASTKPSYNFSEIGSTPTSISGYGITDAYTKSEVDGLVSGVLHYKGTKATVSALPSSGNTTGDVWHVTADGSEWAWDGTTWQELGTAVDLSGYVPTSRTINSKALTGNISLTASDVGALPSSTTIPTKTSDLTNDSGFITASHTSTYSLPLAADGTRGGVQIGYSESGKNYAVKLSSEKMYVTVPWTDTKVTTAALKSGTTYYPILATGTGTATRQIDSTLSGLKYVSTAGTTSAVGTAILCLGNTTGSGTANNEQGVLRLYSSNATYYTDLKSSSASSIKTITLPDKTGTVALTSDIPTVPTKTSDLTNDSGFINSIKTINNQSLIGSGDITVSTTAAQIIRWTESA